MRIGAALTFVLGLALATGLVAYYGFAAVGREFFSNGEAVVPLVATHLVQIALAAWAWQLLLGVDGRGRGGALRVYRWIRISVNALLPVGRVGGEVVGARLLVLSGVGAATAAASVLADKTMEVVAMTAFAWCGLLLAAMAGLDPTILRWGAIGLAVFSGAIAGFIVAQRRGLVKMAEQILLKIADYLREKSESRPGATQEVLWRLYANRNRVITALGLHGAAWSCGAAGVWLALDAMGHPVSLRDAFILEALAQAIAAAAFVMPAALGAQEAGYMVVGGLLGLPPETGLALSLMRRLAELLIGVPGLVFWQILEGKRVFATWTPWRRSARPQPSGSAVQPAPPAPETPPD